MTAPLRPGSLLVDPADVGLLAALVREGVVALGARRPLPPRTGPLLAAIEAAAAAARSSAGTAAVPDAGAPASWLSAEQSAGVLGVSASFVRRLCRTGTLVATRRGPAWSIDPDSATAYVLSRRPAG